MTTPIQTRYKGYYFRSRLEARWAVFFETLQLLWRYEPQGFRLPSGPYLPDFLLLVHESVGAPDGTGYWVEIKPDGEPSDVEKARVVELARDTGRDAFLVAGSPWPGEFRVWRATVRGSLIELHGTDHDGIPSDWMLCDRGYDMGFQVDPADAFRRAREARFEHGEFPGLPLGWEGVEAVNGEAQDDDETLTDYGWGEQADTSAA